MNKQFSLTYFSFLNIYGNETLLWSFASLIFSLPSISFGKDLLGKRAILIYSPKVVWLDTLLKRKKGIHLYSLGVNSFLSPNISFPFQGFQIFSDQIICKDQFKNFLNENQLRNQEFHKAVTVYFTKYWKHDLQRRKLEDIWRTVRLELEKLGWWHQWEHKMFVVAFKQRPSKQMWVHSKPTHES